MKKRITFRTRMIVIFMISLCSCSTNSGAIDPPFLDCNSLVFEGGSSVLLGARTECLLESQVKVLNFDKRVVYTSTRPLAEDSLINVSIFDFDGNLVDKSADFYGRVFFLESKSLILLANTSSHFKTETSQILDLSGKQIFSKTQVSNRTSLIHKISQARTNIDIFNIKKPLS